MAVGSAVVEGKLGLGVVLGLTGASGLAVAVA